MEAFSTLVSLSAPDVMVTYADTAAINYIFILICKFFTCIIEHVLFMRYIVIKVNKGSAKFTAASAADLEMNTAHSVLWPTA